MNIKRLAILPVAAILMVSIIITGTYALNISPSHTLRLGGSLHDDQGESGAKDVYVENWGEKPMFVRIKVSEYMEVGVGAGSKEGENLAKPVIAGTLLSDESTWATRMIWQDNEIAYYWDWTLGGKKWYFPVSESRKLELISMGRAGMRYTDTGSPRGLDETSVSPEGVLAKRTGTAFVMPIRMWHDMGEPIGCYWVFDEDGWAYWAKAILPGQATGLLINSVTLKKSPALAYYYAMNLSVQMGDLDTASPDSYRIFGNPLAGGWTKGAQKLLEKAASVLG